MQISPESKAVIDKLNHSEIIRAGEESIGPLNDISKDVLKTIIDNYNTLIGQPGDSRAKDFVRYYKKVVEERNKNLQTPEAFSTRNITSDKISKKQNKWYLHKIKCHSIRGLASYGETVEFPFEGKSNLMYGPNGSGKSSLLGAVVWAFTGITITDASERPEETDVYQKADGNKKGSKIRPWPTIATLPEGGDIKSIHPDSWVEIELKTKDATNVLYLKRSLEKELQVSSDSNNWEQCKNLNDYGIAPLDLQISLIAPNVLSKDTLDNAPDIIKILSLILGYDGLNDIGELASNIATNRTAYSNKIGKEINTLWETFHSRFHNLLIPLEDGNAIKESLRSQVSKDKPSEENLNEIDSVIQAEITAANKNVADLLGIKDETVSIAGLAEKLIEAIAIFEKGIDQIFPQFSALKYQNSAFSGKTLDEVEKEYLAFCENAKDRIRRRIDWWKKEKEKGCRLALKLRAAKEYDIERKECPVCDRSIDGMPIKDELEQLKKVDNELMRDITDFFNDLSGELEKIIPLQIQKLSETNPSGRILADWEELKTSIDKRLEKIIVKYDPQIDEICKGISEDEIGDASLFDDTDQEVLSAAKDFLKNFRDSLVAIHYLKWGTVNYENVQTQLRKLLTSDEATSLLTELSKSKGCALNIKPLSTIKTNLAQLINDRQTITAKEAEYQLLATMEAPLIQIKKLLKYALVKTEEIFETIEKKAADNWKLLYPESPMGLVPSSLVLERGKKIESLLAKHDYEVLGKYFANVGLQRSIALSFLCALLDKYKGALAFVVFDDPVLSLDEDHRERWADKILSMLVSKDIQIILATHQEQFKKNCSRDFKDGNIVEFNPRDRLSPLSWRSGDELDKIEKVMGTDWKAVPNLLRKYCEQMLIAFQAYTEEDFFTPHDLPKSLDRYGSLKLPNPLVSSRRDNIIAILRKNEIDRVLGPGSHALTENDLTKPMVQDCFNLIKKIKGHYDSEIDQLKSLRRRKKQGDMITPETTTKKLFQKNQVIKFNNIGRAAARPESWVIDSPEQQAPFSVLISTCAHVTGHSFDPVARCGQCVLLAQEDNCPMNGDLVAGQLDEETRYLRRIAFDGDHAFLYSINPLKIIPPIRIEKTQLVSHKVVGIIYEPCRQCARDYTNKASEWQLCQKMDLSYFDKMKMISVEGDSLEPIARKGQKVLVGNSYSPKQCSIEKGGLAVIETDENTKGNMIKRVYPDGDKWIFVSPNPLMPYQPDIVPVEKIKKVWPLRGVIFESIEKE